MTKRFYVATHYAGSDLTLSAPPGPVGVHFFNRPHLEPTAYFETRVAAELALEAWADLITPGLDGETTFAAMHANARIMEKSA